MKNTIIICLFFFTGGIVILGTGIYSLIMASEAKSWPTTEGIVTYSKCVYYYGEMDYMTSVRYSYAVRKKSYTGVSVAFGYSGSWWQRPNQKISDKLSSAKTVLVHYDPDQPANAVLSCGLNGSTALTLFYGSWLMLVSAIVALRARSSQVNAGMLSLSWGSTRFKFTVQGIGDIVLLVVIGLVLVWILGLLIDWGIVNTLVTT